VILVLAFGALVSAGLPLLLGLTAVAGTIGLPGPLVVVQAADVQSPAVRAGIEEASRGSAGSSRGCPCSSS